MTNDAGLWKLLVQYWHLYFLDSSPLSSVMSRSWGRERELAPRKLIDELGTLLCQILTSLGGFVGSGDNARLAGASTSLTRPRTWWRTGRIVPRSVVGSEEVTGGDG